MKRKTSGVEAASPSGGGTGTREEEVGLMRYLSGVLLFKIGYTTVLCFGLLLLPTSLLGEIGFPTCPSTIFLKLLGMAYGALLVAYVFGLSHSLQKKYPRSTVWTGIVSNGGAFLILSSGAFQGAWDAWGSPARIVMWASLAATGLISAGLIAFGPFKGILVKAFARSERK